MKIKKLIEWLEDWDGQLDINNETFTQGLADELGLAMVYSSKDCLYKNGTNCDMNYEHDCSEACKSYVSDLIKD